MRRRVFVLVTALALVAVCVTAFAVGHPTGTSPGHGRPYSESCPRDALPLRPASVGPATRAALADESPSGRPRVISAAWARFDQERGPIARTWCGRRARRRTVVVYIDRRALHPSASLSQGVDFVSRFENGYRVWGAPH